MFKNRERMAKVFFIIFLFSLIISYSAVFGYIDHECVGDGCIICYEINLMKNIFDSLLILSLLYSFIKKVEKYILKISYAWQINYYLTPVKLKVKISE